MRRLTRAALVAGLTVWALGAGSGCADDCGEAASLCEDCEGPNGNCESRFDDASAEYCAEAVRVYEASCGTE
jgi:hypothetical protein